LRAYAAAAELIAYCVLGREAFAQSNDADQTQSVEARLVDAVEMGHGLNARLVLLTCTLASSMQAWWSVTSWRLSNPPSV
jgi:hypothetical protein